MKRKELLKYYNEGKFIQDSKESEIVTTVQSFRGRINIVSTGQGAQKSVPYMMLISACKMLEELGITKLDDYAEILTMLEACAVSSIIGDDNGDDE